MMIETKSLTLRQLSPNDFEAVHSWAGSPENTRYMSWGPNTEWQTREFLVSAQEGKDFAVVLREGGKVIGSCGVYPDDKNDTGLLGWILHKDFWKRGYGTELCGALIRHSFETLKLRRVQAPMCGGELWLLASDGAQWYAPRGPSSGGVLGARG